MPPSARSRRVRGTTALLTALVSSAAALAPVPSHAATDTSTAALASASATSAYLPFDLPSSSDLRASSRKAFAHWVPSLPISLDNQNPSNDYYQRNFLSPTGEKSKHAAYGGFLRDRPLGRSPLSTSSWRLEDMKTEVRSAIAEGLDGFTVVVYNFPADGQTNQQWTNIKLMMQAAGEVDPGFKIIPMPDMTGSLGGTSVATMSKRMAELGRYSSAYRVNGGLVLSPFTTEKKSVSWWSSVKTAMNNDYSTPVTFWPLFQDERKWAPAFSAISYGASNWGYRDPTWNSPTTSWGPVGRMNDVQARGDKWMQPISVQDERPRAGRYWEAGNTQNLRNSWQIALNGGADAVQLTTWNDLPEGSGMQPSPKHGYSFLDLNAYYLTWWKTGVRPTIKRDAIYLTHRKQKISANVTFPQTVWMKRDGGTASRDLVEALVFSRAAGTVQITVGGTTTSCAVDAGVDTCTVPLASGTVSAKLVRAGTVVSSLTSPTKVTSTPYVQDFEYVASSSLRQGTTATTPSVPGTATQLVAASADSYAQNDAADQSVGSASLLMTDGNPRRAAYLRFALPKAPAGKTLTRAVLQVQTTSSPHAGSPSTYTVALSGNSWTEAGLTWNSQPSTSTTLGALVAPSPSTSYSTPLSVATLKPLLGQSASMAVSSSAEDGLVLQSREQGNAAERPQLVLTFG